jgi:tRNA-splicing ligase RtcB
MPKADVSLVSHRAKERGHDQLGTLGSGNHFLEVQVVAEIFDPDVAERFGLHLSQIVVLMHSGSRGLGHQVCTDYLDLMLAVMKKYRICVIDRQLACVPIRSTEGQEYLSAMAGVANFAFANRQMITHQAARRFNTFSARTIWALSTTSAITLRNGNDTVEGQEKEVLVHRKGHPRLF